EWNYSRQLIAVRAAQTGEGGPTVHDLFGPEFLVERPLLAAIREGSGAVLPVDELDRADDEFEAFLLEVLSEFAVSIPEIGRVAALEPPAVVVASNRTRELHDALKRRCLYHWIDHPTLEREIEIVRVPVETRRLVTFCRAATTLDPFDREDLYWAGRASLIARREDIEPFDRAFDAYFGDQVVGERRVMVPDPTAGPQEEREEQADP